MLVLEELEPTTIVVIEFEDTNVTCKAQDVMAEVLAYLYDEMSYREDYYPIDILKQDKISICLGADKAWDNKVLDMLADNGVGEIISEVMDYADEYGLGIAEIDTAGIENDLCTKIREYISDTFGLYDKLEELSWEATRKAVIATLEEELAAEEWDTEDPSMDDEYDVYDEDDDDDYDDDEYDANWETSRNRHRW